MNSSQAGGVSTTTPPIHRLRDRKHYRRSGTHSPGQQQADSNAEAVWAEFSRLRMDEDRIFNQQLDEQDAESAQRYREALAIAAAEHDRVRESAERARETLELEIERERKRRESEEWRVLERERRARAEREAAERRRQKEELERQEEEQRRKAADEKEIADAAARLEEQKRKLEADALERQEAQAEREKQAKEQAEKDRRTKEQEDAARKASAALPTKTPSTATAPAAATQAAAPAAPVATATQQQIAQPSTNSQASATSSSLQERELLHQRYLNLHAKLKEMREYVRTQAKGIPALKKQLGDWKREVIMLGGQVRAEQGGFREPLIKMQKILGEASRYNEPMVDVSQYFISVPTDGTPKYMSGPLVYLLNVAGKQVVAQCLASSPLSVEKADAIGTLAVSLFANPVFKLNQNMSLIDVMIAKFHFCCPVLFGINGNEKTAKGRERIAWWKSEGEWVEQQAHMERMWGLAAGYAAITLRDFSKSKNSHPFPPTNYWRSLSYIVNTPPSEAQPTQFLVLKALVEHSIPRFIKFYGHAAVTALRKALVEFPESAPRGTARDAVLVLREAVQRDLGLVLG